MADTESPDNVAGTDPTGGFNTVTVRFVDGPWMTEYDVPASDYRVGMTDEDAHEVAVASRSSEVPYTHLMFPGDPEAMCGVLLTRRAVRDDSVRATTDEDDVDCPACRDKLDAYWDHPHRIGDYSDVQ